VKQAPSPPPTSFQNTNNDQSSKEDEDDWVEEWEDSEDDSSSNDSMPVFLDRRLRSNSKKENRLSKHQMQNKPAVISVVPDQQTGVAFDNLHVTNLTDDGLPNLNKTPTSYATTALWVLWIIGWIEAGLVYTLRVLVGQ
jgi:hypothetical protein